MTADCDALFGPGLAGSRLNRMIARLTAQRALLEWAVAAVGERPGVFVEIGLGKGRTYDHLRRIAPGRAIFVFEQLLHAPPEAQPPPERLFLGDVRETWREAAAKLGGHCVLAHADIGSHDLAADRALATALAPGLTALLAPGAFVLSDRPLPLSGARALSLPATAGGWPYHLYEMGSEATG